MASIESLEKEIKEIKARNKKVEADKAWETSWERKIIIAGITYFFIVILFYIFGLPNPIVNALVPTIAFVLSTMTLSIFKNIWIKNYKKK